MNHCRNCNSDYEKPGTCNCFAPQRVPALSLPIYPVYLPHLPWQPYPYPNYPGTWVIAEAATSTGYSIRLSPGATS